MILYGVTCRPNENWSLVEPQSQQIFVVNSSPKQVKKPVAVYGNRPGRGRQLHKLKQWESTGSLVSNPHSVNDDIGQMTLRRVQSDAVVPIKPLQPRALIQKTAYPVVEPVTKKIGLPPIPSRQRVDQRNMWKGHVTHDRDNPEPPQSRSNRNQSFLFRTNDYDSLTGLNTAARPTPKSKNNKIIQEEFVWKDTGDYLNQYDASAPSQGVPRLSLQQQVDNNTDYYTAQRPPGLPVYQDYTATQMKNNQQVIPFTKQTGKQGQARFLQLMQPAANTADYTNGHAKTSRSASVSSQPHKPIKHFSELGYKHPSINGHLVDNRLNPQQAQNDNEVVYTEIMPQTFKTQNHKNSDKKNRKLVRSRSASPVIYTDVLPFDSRTTKQFSTNNDRTPMTSTHDVLTSRPQEAFTLKRVPKQPSHPHLQTQLSQAPSEYSISLGIPRLPSWRQSPHPNSNNQVTLLQCKADGTQPFPSTANLDQMLSDTSSSRPSGTIKSALKQTSSYGDGTVRHTYTI